MSDHHWNEVYEYACKAFGQTPRPQDEATVLAVFERNPLLVLRSIDQVANALSQGKITWAWSAFASRLAQAPVRDVVASDGDEQARLVRAAETWIRNTSGMIGVYVYPDRVDEDESELLDELFGHHGLLRAWRDDEVLRERMLVVWRAERPRGVRCEREAEERMAAHGRRAREQALKEEARAAREASLAEAEQGALHTPGSAARVEDPADTGGPPEIAAPPASASDVEQVPDDELEVIF